MYLTCVLLVFHLHSVWLLYSPIELFTGDRPLESYIHEHYCSPHLSANFNSESLIIIDKLEMNSTINLKPINQPIIKHLKLNSCSFVQTHLNMSTLFVHLPVNSYFNTPKVQLIFDFQSQYLNELNFVLLLQSANHIYSQCLSCKPAIFWLSESIVNIKRWSLSALNFLPNNFRAILVLSSINFQQTVHINPIIYGCYQHAGIFTPKSTSDYDLLKMPFDKCNLQSSILNVSVNHWIPICNVRQETDGKITLLHSIEAELLHQLENRYNFRSNFIDEHVVKGQLINGTWNGAVGRVLYGKSNFALCALMNSPERQSVVDFSTYLTMAGGTFIAQYPAPTARRQWIVVEAITLPVWLCFASFLIVLTPILKYSLALSYQKVIFRLFGIIIKQTIEKLHLQSHPTVRLVYCVWFWVAFFFMIIYDSSFYSLLTAPKSATPLDTLQDLERAARDDTHHIVILNHSLYISMFINSSPENRLFHTIGRHMNRTKGNVLSHDDEQIVSVLREPKNVLIGSRSNLIEEQRKVSAWSLHIGSENFISFYTGVILPKRSPLLKPFNKIIDQFQCGGLFHYWSRHFARNATIRQHIYESKRDQILRKGRMKELTMDEMKSIFWLYLSGILIALIGFLLEIWRFIWAIIVL